MWNKIMAVALAVALGAAAFLHAGDPATAGIAVSGDVPKSGTLTAATLEQLGPKDFTWEHKGTTYKFRGVPLAVALESFGLAPGEMNNSVPKSEKRSGWKYVVVASAPDGFQAVFSYAELAKEIGSTKAWLTWELDGKPLPDETGPFRLVITSDAEGARSIQQLASLRVVDMRKIVPPTGASK